ncbi:MAG: glycosyltransferase, partial [Caldilineaceae bacterium]|nr:glycosyltransferase [Caldilineaceae bacterium]
MQIALFHNTPSGGAKRAIYEWTQRLASRHEIDVYTLSSADHTFCDIRPFVQRHQVFDFVPHRLFRSPLGRLNQGQRWRNLGTLLQIGRQIGDQINHGNYDVVFAHTCLYTHIPTVLQFVKRPTVYYLHEPFGRLNARHFQRPYLQQHTWQILLNQIDPLLHLYNQRLATIQHRGVHRVQRLLANSQFTKARVESAFAVETQLCHYGVNTAQFYPMPELPREQVL